MSKSENDMVLDLEDRDPQNLNPHIEVPWENIFGEPHSLRSPECAWSLSQYCFKFSRFGVYTCLSVVCAPVFACILGTSYAIYYFQHIWCAIPSLRLCKISCGVTRSFMRAFAHGLLIPIIDAFGRILAHVRVRTGSIPEQDVSEDEKILII